MNIYNFEFWQGGKWNRISIKAESHSAACIKMSGLSTPWKFISWGN